MKKALPEAIRPPAAIVIAMKLTVLLVVVGCLQVSARGFAQKISFSGTDVSLQQVFSVIEEQTGYGVFMDHDLLQDARKVTISAKDATIDEFLKDCFRNQPFPLTYSIVGHTINIVRKKQAEVLEKDLKLPDVTGSVKGEDGSPLTGATVTILGLNKSGQTNAKGEFEFKNVPNGKYVIVISFVGHDDVRRPIDVVSNEIKVTVVMKLSLNSLDATVIKGYYNTTKRLNTGNVSTVTADVIEKQPVSDPILALAGRVAGLNIQQTSGAPGANNTIQIRGQNSLFNGNFPFFIVDGVPFYSQSLTGSIGGGMLGIPGNGPGQGMSPFNVFNPADIESIEVLKDADATAIYGSRGANGVILITTKKGKAGQTKLDVNVYSGAGKVTRKMNLLNTPDYLKMQHESFVNDSVTNYLTDPAYAIYFPDLLIWDTTRYTNWQKVLIGNSSPFTNAQVNITGGNVNTQFVLGGGYGRQGTPFPGNYSDEKSSGHFGLTNSSADRKFNLQFSADYVNDNNNLPNVDLTNQITLAPDAPALYDSKGNLNWAIIQGTASWRNPLSYTAQNAHALSNNLIGSLNLRYEILPGLQIKSSFGYNRNQMNQSIISPSTFQAPPNNLLPSRRLNTFSTTEAKSWIIEPQIDYSKSIASGHLNVLVGTTFQENSINYQGFYASGFISDALIQDLRSASTIAIAGSSSNLYHYTAFFARVGFDWQDKYLFNITARRDGSSRFGPAKQFGNFGAIGIGWIFSKEKLITNNIPFISFGKLRASYGITGNDQIGDYQFLSTYQSNGLTYQGLVGLSPTGLTNPYFAWEQVKKLEGGLEIGFLKDRVLISASYYRNRSGNQLTGYVLPQITGFNSVQANLPAVLQNSGQEYVLNSINIRLKDFTWTSTFNLSIPHNKLVSYPGLENSVYKYSFTVGQSIFRRYVYHATGVDPQTGVYVFASKSGTGIPSFPNDIILSKPITQSFFGGFGNSFSYKGFHLDVFFQFVKQLAYNYQRYFSQPGSSLNNQPSIVMGRWQKPGDIVGIQKFSQFNSIARNAYYTLTGSLGDIGSDAIISDASFIRLKNLAFSYDLPAGWLRKIRLVQTKLYLQCQNLITITNYQGLDPETQGLSLPPLRMITGGIKISL